jgi:beta-phosphoglucomutase-like phosphatase (HAD superfamily)
MAVFTGASSQVAHLVLQATGLLDAFAAAVTGDEVTGHQHREAALARSSWTSPTICSTLLVMHDLWVSECALQAR